MPTRPLRMCTRPGCREFTPGVYCSSHQQRRAQAYEQQRGTASARGYGARWRKYRQRYLIEHPWCVSCNGLANVVDHVKPHVGDVKLMWDPKNHQAMCSSCHSRKTARVDGGFGNAPRGR
jgi:5-methylcytosine-specific restriction protein A